MEDVNLTADLLIAMCEGIKEKKKIKHYYDLYEKDFKYNPLDLEERFNIIIGIIQTIFCNDFKSTEFTRIHLFYTLFTAIYHIKYGIKDLSDKNIVNETIDFNNQSVITKIRYRLERINYIFDKAEEDIMILSKEEQQFLDYSRRATTDANKRKERTMYLVKLITNDGI